MIVVDCFCPSFSSHTFPQNLFVLHFPVLHFQHPLSVICRPRACHCSVVCVTVLWGELQWLSHTDLRHLFAGPRWLCPVLTACLSVTTL